MSIKIEDDVLYDVSALSKMLGVSERTTTKLLRDEILKGRKLGKRWYLTGSAIKAYFREKNSISDPFT